MSTAISAVDFHSKHITLDALQEELRVNPWKLEEKNGGTQWDFGGNTPLISSAAFGNLKVCEYLLSIGSNVEAKNKVCSTANSSSIENRECSCLSMLLFSFENKEFSYSAQFSWASLSMLFSGDSLQNICVHKTKIYQSTTESKTFASILLALFFVLFFVQIGYNALTVSASRNYIEVVELLLNFRADVNAKNNVTFLRRYSWYVAFHLYMLTCSVWKHSLAFGHNEWVCWCDSIVAQ